MPSNKPATAIDVVPIPSRRTFEEVVLRIREQVASGALKPGDKLPAERDLAEQLHVGRNAVREALRNLENAGLVVMERGVKGGAFICEGNAGRVTQAVYDMMHLGSISVEDLTELRIHLLDAVVRLASERATEDDMDALRALVEATESTINDPDDHDRLRYSLEFYRVLAAATRNRAIAMVVESISDPVVHLLGTIAYSPVELAAARRRFMERFAQRDADGACRELRSLLIALRDHARRVEAAAPAK